MVTIKKQRNLDGSEKVRIEIDHIVACDLVIHPNIPIQGPSPRQELPAFSVESPVPAPEEELITR